MFSKISRYGKLEDVVVKDGQGRDSESKSLRLSPEVSGDFLHTVQEADRLDHLAYKYYKQSRKWWRICDANPEFLFPPALLGKDPMETAHFPLTVADGPEPSWAQLLKTLGETVGITSFHIEKKERALVGRIETIGSDSVTVTVPEYEHTVMVTYNTMNLGIEAVLGLIGGLGFDTGSPKVIGRVGKQIVIPRNIVG